MAEKIAEAYIEISGRTEKAVQAVDKMKADVGRKLDSGGGGEGSLSRFLYGRRGPEGTERSLAKAIGPLAKAFVGGGAFAIGAGLAMKMGEALISTAFGFEKAAQAAEKLTQATEAYNKALDESVKSQMEAAKAPTKKTPLENLEAAISPLKAEDKAKNVVKQFQDKAARERKAQADSAEAASRATVSGQEQESIIGGIDGIMHWTERERRAQPMIDALKKQRRELLQRQSVGHEGIAATNEQYATGYSAIFGAASQAGRAFGGFGFGGGALAGGLKSFDRGAGRTPFEKIAEIQARPTRQENQARYIQLQEQMRHIRDEQTIDKFTGTGKGIGGITDIANVREQIQAAALTPSPHEAEMKRLQLESNALLDDIKKSLGQKSNFGLATVGR